MISKAYFYIMLTFLLFLTACKPIDNSAENINSESDGKAKIADDNKNDTPIQLHSEQAPVYVTAYNSDADTGDAAALEGVLTVKNGCLHVNDILLIVQSPYITWQQDPFILTDGNQSQFKIGDHVVVGGSLYKGKLTDFQVDWKQPPLPECLANEVWHMVGISTVDEIKTLNKDFTP